MATDRDREAFEAALTNHGLNTNFSKIGPADSQAGEYAHMMVQTCWRVWQLALVYHAEVVHNERVPSLTDTMDTTDLFTALQANHIARLDLPNGDIVFVEEHEGVYAVHHVFPSRDRTRLQDRLEAITRQDGIVDQAVWTAVGER